MVLNIVFCITIKALQRLNDITAHCLGKKSSTRSHCDVSVWLAVLPRESITLSCMLCHFARLLNATFKRK